MPENIWKNWGLHLKMTIWFIRPIIIYGSMGWWPKSQQARVIRLLNNVQRLACLCVTVAMRSTPISVIEVLLNLTPLHLNIQSEARSPIALKHPLEKCMGKYIHQKLIKVLITEEVTCSPTEPMVPKHNFHIKIQNDNTRTRTMERQCFRQCHTALI